MAYEGEPVNLSPAQIARVDGYTDWQRHAGIGLHGNEDRPSEEVGRFVLGTNEQRYLMAVKGLGREEFNDSPFAAEISGLSGLALTKWLVQLWAKRRYMEMLVTQSLPSSPISPVGAPFDEQGSFGFLRDEVLASNVGISPEVAAIHASPGMPADVQAQVRESAIRATTSRR